MKTTSSLVTTPSSVALTELVGHLREQASTATSELQWPDRQLALCAEYGVLQWFTGRKWGGQEWSESDLVRGYLALSRGCLATAFILTQRAGACQRIERSDNRAAQQRLLPDLVAGRTFATVGISHLTTSRQHLAQPALRCEQRGDEFLLDGYAPWITGATQAQHLVVGATLEDDRQILVAVPTAAPGVRVLPPEALLALSGTHTGRVEFSQVVVGREDLLAGPAFEVMKLGVGARTGGLQTSTLALGLAKTALDFLQHEAHTRSGLTPPAEALLSEWNRATLDLYAAAENSPNCPDSELRARANSLVLRATQAVLSAAKGAGYVEGHPAGRWCREALFFLVWSCPQTVLTANLCEFAGIEG